MEQLAIKVLAEKRVPKITELLTVFKAVDEESQASKIAKSYILSTRGGFKLGDQSPITLKDTEAWCNLISHYSINRDDPELALEVWSLTLNLIFRSLRTNNSQILLDFLSREWNEA